MSNIKEYQSAVDVIKTAILQSQARAAKAVNQEQLALYYGIGRYISMNTRNKNWGTGAIETISKQLRQDLPGLRGFGVSSLKNMRIFYEAWCMIEPNSPIGIGELSGKASETIEESNESIDSQVDTIRQLQLANFPDSYWRTQKTLMSVFSIYDIAIIISLIPKTYLVLSRSKTSITIRTRCPTTSWPPYLITSRLIEPFECSRMNICLTISM